eukprot:CAMPEP_0206476030 /NCGR_PEP_ID=MMETSP0324_2-20121206/34459_1 /ASSEMBLY_ACC=CAM_ASM_000836 /TAXON_ID=2866 /ORGANISM="Crypthecodinium cohnii, Strain Seligo" /LENGTH=124 /DNA_ID=CAMNT_0053951555 /DNA_START=68 /DNA_END=439 /DNA_ORIENTATION=+
MAISRVCWLLLFALPGALADQAAQVPLQEGAITPEMLMQDDVCEQDSPDNQACALHLRALRGQVLQATVKAHTVTDSSRNDEGSDEDNGDKQEQAAQLFENADMNQDGEIHEGELQALFQSLGE